MKFDYKVLFLVAALVTVSAVLSGEVLVNGAGATFPNPIYQKWFSEYHKAHPDVQINYQQVGSGAGKNQVTAGTVDFGATDGPMTDKELATFKQKNGCDVFHLPTVLGAVVPIYNIPGITEQVNFTGEALAGIYLGKITKWSDPAIAKANPKLKFPDAAIAVVHRADSSGTSYTWTDFLSKVSPEWKSGPGTGTSVEWPTGIGARQNDGVSGQIKNTKNSIGYVELIYAVANKMTFGKVKNLAGNFISASLAGVSAAAAGSAKTMPDDFRVSITNAPGKDSYPISTFTWLLIPEKIKDPAKRKVITDFVKWALTGGQDLVEALDYAKVPKPVVDKELKTLAKVM